MKLRLQKEDPITGQSRVYGIQVTVKACRPLVYLFYPDCIIDIEVKKIKTKPN